MSDPTRSRPDRHESPERPGGQPEARWLVAPLGGVVVLGLAHLATTAYSHREQHPDPHDR
jgi:hypothetical protein